MGHSSQAINPSHSSKGLPLLPQAWIPGILSKAERAQGSYLCLSEKGESGVIHTHAIDSNEDVNTKAKPCPNV